MRKLQTLAAVLFLGLLAYGAPVPRNQAEQVALNWMRERLGISAQRLEVGEVFVESESSNPVYYVFNTNPSGFVIVAADDVSYPVIAYAKDGSYALTGHPPAFDAMMDAVKEEIAYARSHGLSSLDKTARSWQRLSVHTSAFIAEPPSTAVAPMTQTKWGQGKYYNQLCPRDGAGEDGHCVTGCVATAMAQIMKKWNHPPKGDGWGIYFLWKYGIQWANFGATSYRWSSMSSKLADYNTSVATLMYHCGVSVKMDYGPKSSSACAADARDAFVDHFRYDPLASFVWRGGYPGSWVDTIRFDLDNGRPLYYRGQGKDGGHAFVVDGYEGTDHFHINWGWDSVFNGYYYLDDLTPGSSNFNFRQGAIFKVMPDGVDVALVIDRSGSMGGSGYMEPAKTAASTFVSFMQNGDGVAVVSFNQQATVDFRLTTITSDATKSAVQSAIRSIRSDGRTSIGDGIQSGQGELARGNTRVHQAMVLLSDGWENEPPWVADILPRIPRNTDIYTIALGPDSDQGLLMRIARTTEGEYFYAPGPSQLLSIYDFIRGRVTGRQNVADFDGVVRQGQTVVHSAVIDDMMTEATFSLTFGGSDVDLELATPSGAVIDPAVAETSATIEYVEGPVFDYYRVGQPEAGTWRLRVVGVDVPSPESYKAMVQGVSDLTMEGFLGMVEPQVRESVPVFARLQGGGQPVSGASVIAAIEPPPGGYLAPGPQRHNAEETGQVFIPALDNAGFCRDSPASPVQEGELGFSPDTLILYDDGHHGDSLAGDGIYANYFTATDPGSYSFTLKASGSIPQGGQFERLVRFSAYVDTTSRPAAPMLSSPQNGAVGVPLVPTLCWRSSRHALTYRLQVAANPDFSNPVVDSGSLTDTSFLLAGLSCGTSYCWRVRAKRYTLMSDWSPKWWFSTVESSEEVAVSPNPFVPARGHTVITFFGAGLPGADVQVYNKAGETVREFGAEETAGSDRLAWDAKGVDGKLLASGVYVYAVKQKSGTVFKGKFTVIR